MRRFLVLTAALTLWSLCDARPARQLLPPVKGYVPVYIRNGDTPLEDINLDLAEAFHAIPSGRSAGRASLKGGRSENSKEYTKLAKVDSAPLSDDKNGKKAQPIDIPDTPEIASVKHQDKKVELKSEFVPNEVTKELNDIKFAKNDSPMLIIPEFEPEYIQK